MSGYLELANRCEEAAGADRELDAAIAVQLGEAPNYEGDGVYGCRRFTSSIDVALTLAGGIRGLSLHIRSNPHMGGKDYIVSAGSNRAEARSWALGLCAVGLRDRAKWATPFSNGERDSG